VSPVRFWPSAPCEFPKEFTKRVLRKRAPNTVKPLLYVSHQRIRVGGRSPLACLRPGRKNFGVARVRSSDPIQSQATEISDSPASVGAIDENVGTGCFSSKSDGVPAYQGIRSTRGWSWAARASSEQPVAPHRAVIGEAMPKKSDRTSPKEQIVLLVPHEQLDSEAARANRRGF
jgi:hypothetical protein